MKDEKRPVQAEIRILLLENGQLEVSCPIDNKILCLGLLEQAKHIVNSHPQVKSPIALAVGGGIRLPN